jgi:hypothetical protein
MLGPRSDEPVPTLVKARPTFKLEASPVNVIPLDPIPMVLN